MPQPLGLQSLGPGPLVAVIFPALNEAGKIGRVLDKLPRDGRFEAIVVDDGSTDGTGDDQHEPDELAGALGLVATLIPHVRVADLQAAGSVPATVSTEG